MQSKNKKIKVGIALGGGGPRGLAHIGVIKSLVENNISIDCIAGTSAGALIGGLYASIGSVSELEKIADKISLGDLVGILRDVGSFSAIIRGSKIESSLEKYMKEKNIESLSIPFAAVSTDLKTGSPISIRSGSLAKAIHASAAIPVIFDGVDYDNTLLVDGGASAPVPVTAVKSMGADVVVAVNLNGYLYKSSPQSNVRPNISEISMAAIHIMQHNLAKEQCVGADVVITPEVHNVPLIDLRYFVNGKNIIEKGYIAAQEQINKIRKLLT